jgi:hypothetical protein
MAAGSIMPFHCRLLFFVCAAVALPAQDPPSSPGAPTLVAEAEKLGAAGDIEGAIHTLWQALAECESPDLGFLPVLASARFEPSLTSRGAYGVLGLLLTELMSQFAGEELVVATMSGDLIVFSADTMVERFRTHVDGAIGFYNSMLAADLVPDPANRKELYVAGSHGLWRFNQP